jgi:hypothetical protein
MCDLGEGIKKNSRANMNCYFDFLPFGGINKVDLDEPVHDVQVTGRTMKFTQVKDEGTGDVLKGIRANLRSGDQCELDHDYEEGINELYCFTPVD